MIISVRSTPLSGLEIEQCSNRRRNLVPGGSGGRFAWHTYQKSAPEKWSRFVAPISGACVMGVSVACRLRSESSSYFVPRYLHAVTEDRSRRTTYGTRSNKHLTLHTCVRPTSGVYVPRSQLALGLRKKLQVIKIPIPCIHSTTWSGHNNIHVYWCVSKWGRFVFVHNLAIQ